MSSVNPSMGALKDAIAGRYKPRRDLHWLIVLIMHYRERPVTAKAAAQYLAGAVHFEPGVQSIQRKLFKPFYQRVDDYGRFAPTRETMETIRPLLDKRDNATASEKRDATWRHITRI